jgi:hypothetical protein
LAWEFPQVAGPLAADGLIGTPNGEEMNRTDKAATTRVVTWIVGTVAVFAAADSWTHIYDLAREHGPGGVVGVISAALLPLSIDGMVAAGSATMLAAAKHQIPVPLRARVILVTGLATTVWANAAYGLAQGRTSAFLSVLSVVAYFGAAEALVWMRENLSTPKAGTPRTRTDRVPATPAAGIPAPADELSDRREARARESDEDLMRRAEAAFSGQAPGVKPIRERLGVGQAKAQLVRNHLQALQAAAG